MSLWKKLMIADVTGAGDTWPIDSLRATGFKVGSNPELFAIDDMTLEPGDRVELAGARLYQLLVQHEVVLLQHLPPPEFVERLKNDGVEEVLLWVGYESIGQTPPWSVYAEPLHRIGFNHRLVVNDPNSFGEYFVDAYEASEPDPPAKPHTWAVDVLKPGYAAEFVQCLGNLLFQVYGSQHPRIFFDNVLDREYYGMASNAPNRNDPERIAKWQLSWKQLLGYCRKIGQVPIWGNTGAVNYQYPELDVKFDELIFTSHLTAAEIIALVNESMRRGSLDRHGKEQGYCFHVSEWSGGFLWANDPSGWEVLKAGIKEKPVYVNTARTGHFLFHPGRSVCT